MTTSVRSLHKHFDIIRVAGDGDCFFHTFVLGMKTLNVEFYPEISDLRDIIATYMKTYPYLFDIFIKERLEANLPKLDLNQSVQKIISGEWATNSMIHILACHFAVRVKIYKYSEYYKAYLHQIFPNEEIIKCPHPIGKLSEETICIVATPNHYDFLTEKTILVNIQNLENNFHVEMANSSIYEVFRFGMKQYNDHFNFTVREVKDLVNQVFESENRMKTDNQKTILLILSCIFQIKIKVYEYNDIYLAYVCTTIPNESRECQTQTMIAKNMVLNIKVHAGTNYLLTEKNTIFLD